MSYPSLWSGPGSITGFILSPLFALHLHIPPVSKLCWPFCRRVAALWPGTPLEDQGLVQLWLSMETAVCPASGDTPGVWLLPMSGTSMSSTQWWLQPSHCIGDPSLMMEGNAIGMLCQGAGGQELGLVGGAQDSRALIPSQVLPRCRYFALPSRSVRAKLFSFLGACTGAGAKHDMLGLNIRKALEHLSAAQLTAQCQPGSQDRSQAMATCFSSRGSMVASCPDQKQERGCPLLPLDKQTQ